MNKYHFVIRGPTRKSIARMIYIYAISYKMAIEKVLTKNPNKYIRINKTNMDLISSQDEAKKLSKKEKDTLYYVILEEDEFEVRRFDKVNPDKDDIYSTWSNGVKIDNANGIKEAEEQIISTIKTTNKMAQKTAKKKTAKKAAKKVATKKVAKKNGTKAVKAPKEGGKIVAISVKDMLKGIKKGYIYRNKQNVLVTEKALLKRANHDYVLEGITEFAPVK